MYLFGFIIGQEETLLRDNYDCTVIRGEGRWRARLHNDVTCVPYVPFVFRVFSQAAGEFTMMMMMMLMELGESLVRVARNDSNNLLYHLQSSTCKSACSV
jgi:hypothetical protein